MSDKSPNSIELTGVFPVEWIEKRLNEQLQGCFPVNPNNPAIQIPILEYTRESRERCGDAWRRVEPRTTQQFLLCRER
jgi:hypothetical protein